MAEELQSLIEKIQKEGVEKAEKEAENLIKDAKDRAEQIVKEAEQKSEDIIKKGRKEAEVFMDRSVITLEHSARDIIISVGKGVEKIFTDLISETVDDSLSDDAILQIVIEMSKAYVEKGFSANDIRLLVSPGNQKSLKTLYLQKYKEAIKSELTINSDERIMNGFKISFKDGRVYHDFTREAIAEALSTLIRPQLAEIVKKAAGEQVKGKELKEK